MSSIDVDSGIMTAFVIFFNVVASAALPELVRDLNAL